MLSIVFGTMVLHTKNLKLVFIVFFSLCLICSLVLCFIFKRKFLIFISICLLIVTIPLVQIYSKTSELHKLREYAGMDIVVSGRISDNYKITSGGSLNIVLDSVELIGPDFKVKTKGKVSVYTNPNNFNLEDFSIGRFVSVMGKLSVYDLENIQDYTMFNLSKDINSSIYVNHSKLILKDKTNIMPDEFIRATVFNKIEAEDIEYGDVGYAMLFGESVLLEQDILEAFRTTGIAHLLAVSGLHVSIIAAIISFVLKRAKVSNVANLIIMTVLLAIYSYLCNFSVSVVRASLMMIMYLYLKVRGKCYDRLSALSLSAIIILLTNPLNLFNVSFILSFMAVFSITVLAKTLEKLFGYFLKNKAATALSVVFAVQVGLIFVQLYFFKKYTVLSLVYNLIAIPVATIAFEVFIITLLLSSVLPFLSVFFKIFELLMGLVVKFVYTVSKIGLMISVNNLNFWIVLLGIAIMITASNFIFAQKRYKAVGISLFMLIGGILLFVWC